MRITKFFGYVNQNETIRKKMQNIPFTIDFTSRDLIDRSLACISVITTSLVQRVIDFPSVCIRESTGKRKGNHSRLG